MSVSIDKVLIFNFFIQKHISANLLIQITYFEEFEREKNIRETIYDKESEKNVSGEMRGTEKGDWNRWMQDVREKRRKFVMRNALWPKHKCRILPSMCFSLLIFFQIHFRKHESEQCWLERSRVHSIAYFISISSSSQFIYIVTDSQKPAKIWKTFSRSKLLLLRLYSIDSRYFYWNFFRDSTPLLFTL